MSIDHLLIAKAHYERAREDLRLRAPLSAGFAVSALQDAVEIILVGLASQYKVKIGNRFEDLWKTVDDAIPTGDKLPYPAQMQRLNKARVNFKHYGTLPDGSQVESFRANAEAFLEDVAMRLFDICWEDVSEIDLLGTDPEKDHLRRAQTLLADGKL